MVTWGFPTSARAPRRQVRSENFGQLVHLSGRALRPEAAIQDAGRGSWWRRSDVSERSEKGRRSYVSYILSIDDYWILLDICLNMFH